MSDTKEIFIAVRVPADFDDELDVMRWITDDLAELCIYRECGDLQQQLTEANRRGEELQEMKDDVRGVFYGGEYNSAEEMLSAIIRIVLPRAPATATSKRGVA